MIGVGDAFSMLVPFKIKRRIVVAKSVEHFSINTVGIVDMKPIVVAVFTIVLERHFFGVSSILEIVHTPTIAVEVKPIDFIVRDAIAVDVA